MTLSVITPVFNAAAVVGHFTGNILGQVDKPDAVIFVDDGSQDCTAAALAAAAARLNAAGVQCQIVTHPNNMGRGAARQSGLAATNTTYVTWLDIDDLFGPLRIARLRVALLARAMQAGLWLLATPYTLCQARRISVRQPVLPRAVSNVAALYTAKTGPRTLQLQALAGPLEAFRSVGFDADISWSEDLDFVLRFLDAGGRVDVVDSADTGAPQAEDVIYFQSFTRTGRDQVEGGNRRVYDKNRSIFDRNGIDPDAELARKIETYITRFTTHPEEDAPPSALRDAGPDLSQNEGEAWMFIAPDDTPVLFASTGLEWDTIIAAFVEGADRLRRSSTQDTLHTIVDHRITRASGGLFDLQDGGRIVTSDLGLVASWADTTAPSGRFQPVFSRLSDPATPLFISFFAGAPFYRECAKRLAAQLDAFGVDYQICEFIPDAGIDWTRICRKKIAYYTAQHRRHGRPIFWIDTDSQLVGDPRSLGTGQDSDIGAFLRNFTYLVDFDPLRFARLLHPGYLRFGTGKKMAAFFAHMDDVDRAAPENATDDWVLQEALSTFGEALKFTLFPPSAVVTTNEAERTPDTVFQHTDSGNVSAAAKTAAQHEAQAMSPERQLPVLREGARVAMTRGELRDAASFYKRIRQVAPEDTDSLVRLLGVYDRLGEVKKYAYHFDRAKKTPALRGAALRADLDRLYNAGQLDDATKVGQTLIDTGTAEEQAFARSRAYRHGFDVEAVTKGISDDDRVRMMWWEQPFPGNLGDIIGPYVIRAMTGVPPRYSKSSPRLLSIGSIIRFAKAGDTVWGAGAAAQLQELDPLATFRAVRGPLTRDLVLKAGAACPEVYGDPAWFLPLIRPCRDVAKTHRLGLIRHFTHETRPLDVAPDVREIGIIRDSVAGIEAFLDEMNACDAIISTSLHGLIIAQAYGIPAIWAIDTASGRQIHGDGMKFTDYALSVGMPETVPFDLASVPRINAALAAICTHLPTRPIDLKRLANAAPFKISEAFQALL